MGITHANIFFSYFYNSRLNFCIHRKEAFFPRKGYLTLALMGEIVWPLLISPFFKNVVKKDDYGILKQITHKKKNGKVVAKAVVKNTPPHLNCRTKRAREQFFAWKFLQPCT